MFFVVFLTFSESTFSPQKIRSIISVSNSFDPDQDRHSVGPDLGPNCLHCYQQMSITCKELTRVLATLNSSEFKGHRN